MSTELERKWVKPAQISKHLFCCICNEVFKTPTRLKCRYINITIIFKQKSKVQQ